MGKRLIQQARGKGGPTYRAPSFRYRGAPRHAKESGIPIEVTVTDLMTCRGHSAPLAEVAYSTGGKGLMIAPEGIKVGSKLISGDEADLAPGNATKLKNLQEGTLVYNIESSPLDGGKFCRSSGTFARIVSKTKDRVTVQLPSKKQKTFSGECRANLGIVAGGGRPEKPFLKAGKRHFAMKAKNKLYPLTSAASMNAVDHPFGSSRSSRKSKARAAPHNAPPGRKVGMWKPRRSGRKKK